MSGSRFYVIAAGGAAAIGRDLLLPALARGKADILRLQLEAGADPNAADSTLKLAVQRRKPEFATILKAAGTKG